jgi:glycosyltransferase involved in cell wall biosynthesis
MTTPRILLLVDWKPEKRSLLVEYVQKRGMHCDILGTDFKLAQWTPISKIFSHWPRCLWVSIQAFQRRNDYDYMIAWQQTIGFLLGFIKFITHSSIPRVFSLNTTIVERKNPCLDMIRRCFMVVASKRIDHLSFLCSSSMYLMQERWHLSKDQSAHLVQPLTFENNPDFSGFKPESYLYSVGLSYRDYHTLMEAAKKTSRLFVVVTTDAFLKGLDIPKNVTIYRNTFGDAALELLKNSAAVIFPLEKTFSPAGLTALINAMCYGKPVIATRSMATEEYITHGETGLLVAWKDPDAIVDAINAVFADPENANAMGCRARQAVLQNHSMEVYLKKIVDIIQGDLCRPVASQINPV